MPRQPRAERLLLAKEAGLLAERQRIDAALDLVEQLRKELSAAPKRSRAKRTPAPANDGVATTA